MSNRTFVRLMLSVPVTFGLLCGLWLSSAHAAEPVCTRTEVLVTTKSGAQHIAVHTVCSQVTK